MLSAAFAHSRNSAGVRHALEDHLRATAELTAQFADAFGARDAGYYLGLWHDAGKFDPAWQRYLLDSESGRAAHAPDHKAAGTKLAEIHAPFLALPIQGHHGGLRSLADLKAWLPAAGDKPGSIAALAAARQALPDLEPTSPVSPPSLIGNDPLSIEMFVRMLFSALVDADSRDTESHKAADQARLRDGSATIDQLCERFERFHATIPPTGSRAVQKVRSDLYQACRAAAGLPPGLFRLSAPTGSGKTLSGLAFALHHARHQDLRRIVVAVPFITITEQTAAAYRRALADPADVVPPVLEHHSGAKTTETAEDGSYLRSEEWSQLAAENWDAPVIVTTTVQLFESLFANRRGPCTKIHRLARSVIVLDEAQTLPIRLLEPILSALRQLCETYGSTVVICTATQPAFRTIPAFADLPAVDVVSDPGPMFNALRRVECEWRTETTTSWPEVARWMSADSHVLAIVNTKRDAMALLDELDPDPAVLHLSTLLCGAHRREVLVEVSRRLSRGEPCRLVSTQVVEAGVDLDFPLVLRALGPFDSIIQAAGRCNRQGLAERGRLIVFEPEGGGSPPGRYRTAVGLTRSLMHEAALDSRQLDIDDPSAADRYFRLLLQDVTDWGAQVQAARRELDYPRVAELFRMIDDDSCLVVVQYDGGELTIDERSVMLDALRRGVGSARALRRQLQPFTVALRRNEYDRLLGQGYIRSVIEGFGEWLGQYDSVRGIVLRDPEILLV